MSYPSYCFDCGYEIIGGDYVAHVCRDESTAILATENAQLRTEIAALRQWQTEACVVFLDWLPGLCEQERICEKLRDRAKGAR